MTIQNQLTAELQKAKKESPCLSDNPEAKGNLILEKILREGTESFEHVSHNSHGDWHKHWASGKGPATFSEPNKPEEPKDIIKPAQA